MNKMLFGFSLGLAVAAAACAGDDGGGGDDDLPAFSGATNRSVVEGASWGGVSLGTLAELPATVVDDSLLPGLTTGPLRIHKISDSAFNGVVAVQNGSERAACTIQIQLALLDANEDLVTTVSDFLLGSTSVTIDELYGDRLRSYSCLGAGETGYVSFLGYGPSWSEQLDHAEVTVAAALDAGKADPLTTSVSSYAVGDDDAIAFTVQNTSEEALQLSTLHYAVAINDDGAPIPPVIPLRPEGSTLAPAESGIVDQPDEYPTEPSTRFEVFVFVDDAP